MVLILASASPRRAELLRQVGLPYRVMPSFIEEGYFHLPPPERVMSLALDKARKVASRLDRGVVLGADTVVVAGMNTWRSPGIRRRPAGCCSD